MKTKNACQLLYEENTIAFFIDYRITEPNENKENVSQLIREENSLAVFIDNFVCVNHKYIPSPYDSDQHHARSINLSCHNVPFERLAATA